MTFQLEALGAYIRHQRNLANLSIRQLAAQASVSNAYLSQIERGLHEPSVRVLTSLADALNLSAATLLAQAGVSDDLASDTRQDDVHDAGSTERAILNDPALRPSQRQALLGVYRSFLADAADADEH